METYGLSERATDTLERTRRSPWTWLWGGCVGLASWMMTLEPMTVAEAVRYFVAWPLLAVSISGLAVTLYRNWLRSANPPSPPRLSVCENAGWSRVIVGDGPSDQLRMCIQNTGDLIARDVRVRATKAFVGITIDWAGPYPRDIPRDDSTSPDIRPGEQAFFHILTFKRKSMSDLTAWLLMPWEDHNGGPLVDRYPVTVCQYSVSAENIPRPLVVTVLAGRDPRMRLRITDEDVDLRSLINQMRDAKPTPSGPHTGADESRESD